MEGQIIRGIGGFYTVVGRDGQFYQLRAQSKLRRARLTPLVGDYVSFEPSRGEEDGWLTAILPRRNSLIRPPVANIDKLVITVSAGTPKPDLMLADRLLMLALQKEISPVVVINKSEEEPDTAADIACQYKAAAERVFIVSAREGEGLDALKEALRGSVHTFSGQSGVGKSTLINALYGLDLETGRLSDKIERGKNTTRHTQLFPVEGGGMVLDTPGFSLFESDLIEPIKLRELYPEFAKYEGQCRFDPCAHDKEPGCAVKEAVREGVINAKRHERYCLLYEEMTTRWRERYD